MIEAIREIGEYSLIKQGKRLDNPIDIIVEDPASNESYKHVFTIILKRSNEEFIFERINQEEYSPDRISKYLYRQGSSRGTDYTPTARLTEKPENTLKSKFVNWFKDVINDKNLNLDEIELIFIKTSLKCLEKNYEKILSEFKEKVGTIPKKETGLITLKYFDKSEKYLGDIPVFSKILTHYYSADLSYSDAYKTTSKSENQICSVCKKKSPEVFGFVSTYSFYNVDKPGFVSGGFNRDLAWKNYPVCLTCALTLEEGKQYVEKNFDNFKFYGVKYCIIPKIIQNSQNQDIYKIISDFRGDIQKNLKISREHEHLLSSIDEEILDILAQQENYLNNNFMFYEIRNSAFRILLYMEDILPSRLRTLFNAKKNVDKKEIFKNFDAKGGSLLFTFGHIRQFFSSGFDQDLTKYFLEITNNIFTNKKIDYPFLIHAISQTIQKEFADGKSTKLLSFQGLQLLDYLNYLKLLKFNEGGSKMNEKQSGTILDEITSPLDENVERIFNEFPDFFNEPAKKAVFLQGLLTESLLYTQRKERNVDRGSEPFRNKLRGLKLDEQLVKRLLPEIQNKLEEYGKNYHSKLEEQISKYMIVAGNNWKISKDEISFYYVLGMDLSYFVMMKKGGK
jgi:CRISPR-associated protein Csh1